MDRIETENDITNSEGVALLRQFRENLGMRTDEFLRIPQSSFSDIKWTVEIINKREIGKLLLKLVGNEGNKDDKEMASTRRLLQELIDYYPNERPYVWKNAKVTIINIKSNTVTIQSGKGLHKFLVKYGKNGQTHLHKFHEGPFVDFLNKIMFSTIKLFGIPSSKIGITCAISATNSFFEREILPFDFLNPFETCYLFKCC